MGIRDRPVSARSLIGSIRGECLDHVVVVGERHLRHVLATYQKYYNEVRTHLSLQKDAPVGVMCAERGAWVRRRSWAGYTINMFEFEFATGTGGEASVAACPRQLGFVLAQRAGRRLHRGPSRRSCSSTCPGATTKIADLHILCANCHRMITRAALG
jgi:hypothetical protein